MAGGIEMLKTGAHSFCTHRVRTPLPLLILKIGLLIALLALSVFFIFHFAIYKAKFDWQPPPMILVPGLMGNKLYVEGFGVNYPAELNKCPRDIPLRKSWIGKEFGVNPKCELYLLQLDSAFKNMPNVRVTASPPGVQFGKALGSVECIGSDTNPRLCDFFTLKGNGDSYFRPLAEFLMARLKYQPGKTLFAAPYDWRQDQQSEVMEEYYDNLQFLVEHTFNLTNRRVFLLGHSMGNIVINRFLRLDKITPEWQKQHLQGTINVAAPYGGATKTMQMMYSGGEIADAKISPEEAKEFVRKMGFPATLLPFKNAFGEETLLSIKDDKYSPQRMVDFLAKVKSGNLAKFYLGNEPQPQPHTPMHCIYSIGHNNTEYKYTYSTDSEQSKPQIEYGDGDHTVNAESLRVCQQWKQAGQPVEVEELGHWEHSEILAKPDFFAYIAKVITDV